MTYLSGAGSFIVAVIAVVGVVVYQAEANAKLESEVKALSQNVIDIKSSLKDDRKEFHERLKEQDNKIDDLIKQIVELRVKVRVLEETNKQ